MSEIRVDRLTNETETGGPNFVGVVTFSATSHVNFPVGTTTQRPIENAINPGTIRFNSEVTGLEYYDGDRWWQIAEFQNTAGRGLIAGGFVAGPTTYNIIEYVTISTIGNTTDFGDLYTGGYGAGALSSSTRGVFAGASSTNTIQYVTISATGNSIDFGDLTLSGRSSAGVSNRTRGVFGGRSPGNNTMDYITIATLGNALDFGDLLTLGSVMGGCGSPTRGIFSGSADPISIQYITIATTGNAVDFGDLSVSRTRLAACSSSIRATMGGGLLVPATQYNVIDYVTITTLGNATDFGDLTAARDETSSCSTEIRGIWAGGRTVPSPEANTNIIDYITIASTGNATDFGDIVTARRLVAACSDSHGGL